MPRSPAGWTPATLRRTVHVTVATLSPPSLSRIAQPDVQRNVRPLSLARSRLRGTHAYLKHSSTGARRNLYLIARFITRGHVRVSLCNVLRSTLYIYRSGAAIRPAIRPSIHTEETVKPSTKLFCLPLSLTSLLNIYPAWLFHLQMKRQGESHLPPNMYSKIHPALERKIINHLSSRP